MMFKNSCRLLFANFAEVWKLLVYHILSFAVSVALLAVFYKNYIDYATIASANAGLPTAWETGTLYGANFSKSLTIVANFMVEYFKVMFTSNIGIGIYFCVIIFLLLPLLMNIGKVVSCELMYGYMSACQRQSFTGTYLKTLRSSLAYSSVKVLYAIPFNFLILFGMWALTRIDNGVYDYFMPVAFVLLAAALMAIKELFNAGWAPAKVVYNHNVFSSYTIGMRAVLRRGARVYSTAFIIYLLATVLAMVLGLYAIIVILPIVPIFVHIFEMVAFFSSQGMRFYVDNDTILSPKRLEEVDKLDDAKYIL